MRAASISGDRMARRRVAILISGRGSNMSALIAAAQAPDFPAEISLVLSNCPSAAGLASALAAGIVTATVDHTRFGKDREAFERALQDELEAQRIDIVCLAGFMRLLTPWFVSLWRERMLNIHPALLPAFKGLDTHERALAAGIKIHGATVHFVVPEMDSGPVIAQGAVGVREDPRRSRRAYSRSSIASTRWRSASSRRVACASRMGAAVLMAHPRATTSCWRRRSRRDLCGVSP
jgi:phosphoribosylglycinamide formyltransferase 1